MNGVELYELWKAEKDKVMRGRIESMKESVEQKGVVILDFETTGANITNHPDKKWGYFKGKTWYDAIQIALIDTSVLDSSTKSGYKEYSWRLMPHKDYHTRKDWATSIHGHSRDEYLLRTDLVNFTDIYPELARILNDKTVVAHNAFGFDKSVLEQMAEKYNVILPVFNWRDTKDELVKMYPDKKHSQKAVAAWMGFDNDFEGHDALVDVQMLTKIYHRIEEIKTKSDDFYFV